MKHIIFVFLLCFASSALAQKNDASIDEIEGLFKEEAETDDEFRQKKAPPKKEKKKEEKEPEEISDLKRLETFDDIAVIQKRFLPKTGRFEFYFGGGTNLNDAFFVGNGISARLGYYFSENWSVEGMYSYIQNDNRDVTNSLLQKGVSTEGSVSTDGYVGVDVKWTPIYGKFAYFNEKIIPFDLYFTFGVGKTEPKFVNSSVTGSRQILSVDSPYTIKLGTGQIFAITKWMAFRWDIAMHFVQADSTIIDNGVTESKSDMSNNMFLNVGLSFFFPEANYR